jgi:hypothetical protein
MQRTALRRPLFFSALFGAVVFCVPSLFAAPKPRPVAVKSFTAPCEVKRKDTPGRWFTARVGSELKAGDVIRTGKGGKALLAMSDGSRMTLGPNSRLNVEEVAPNRVFGLDVGKVKSYVHKLRKDSKFEIKTPLAAASVRGTVFEVGFNDQTKEGSLAVDEGTVSLTKDGKEIFVHEGERVGYTADLPLAPPAPQGSGSGSGGDREAVRREVGLGMSKEEVMAAAADEMRLAEYQEGKVLTDVFGKRVRLEEYIIRRPKEAAVPDNSFKLVVLNEREDRFDYFYYRGDFNTALPTDLSAAFREMNGKLGVQPTYVLTSYEMSMSNTQDYVKDNGSNGHLVEVTFDGTSYTLHDPTGAVADKTVAADQGPVTVAGVTYEKVYDPVKDQYSTVTQEQFAAGDYGTAVYDASNDTFHPITTADTFWRTSFNDYTHVLNGVTKQGWTSSQNILSLDTDATFTYDGGVLTAVTTTPSGADKLYNQTTLYYSGAGTTETYDTYIIDDDGKIASTGSFLGLTTGTAFKSELLHWNYEQVVTATEFGGRKIDLVVEPKILIKSGLIK